MTLRIDRIHFETTPRHLYCGSWEIEIKGVEGRGEYGTLRVMQDKLYLQTWSEKLAPEIELLAECVIPPDADKQIVSRHVAQALLTLGWGPEINQNGHVMNSAAYQWQVAWR
jgi:hypothetical protein